jgi:hypothetical protein
MIWAIIPGPVKRAMAWLLAGLGVVAGVWGLAKRDARRGAALDAAEGYIETRKEIDDATDNLPADDMQLRERLRQRDPRTR